jgi:hypothetical protein
MGSFPLSSAGYVPMCAMCVRPNVKSMRSTAWNIADSAQKPAANAQQNAGKWHSRPLFAFCKKC